MEKTGKKQEKSKKKARFAPGTPLKAGKHYTIFKI